MTPGSAPRPHSTRSTPATSTPPTPSCGTAEAQADHDPARPGMARQSRMPGNPRRTRPRDLRDRDQDEEGAILRPVAQFIDDYCAGCPVVTECLDAGATERYGVWGGVEGMTLTEADLQRTVLDMARWHGLLAFHPPTHGATPAPDSQTSCCSAHASRTSS